MALEMMDADQGPVERRSQAAGHRHAGEQRARQPRALGAGHGIDVTQAAAGIGQRLSGERQQPADVVTRGELGHHAAVALVHGHLRMQALGEQALAGAVERDAGFVAGGFDAEHEHGAIVPQPRRPGRPKASRPEPLRAIVMSFACGGAA
jgi:hypothetical protein